MAPIKRAEGIGQYNNADHSFSVPKFRSSAWHPRRLALMAALMLAPVAGFMALHRHPHQHGSQAPIVQNSASQERVNALVQDPAFRAKALAALQNYRIGQTATMADIHSLHNDTDHFSASGQRQWIATMERETTAGLHKLLTHPDTQYFLGPATPASERLVTGRYRQSKDDLAGMRLIAYLNLDINTDPAKPPDKRTITAIFPIIGYDKDFGVSYLPPPDNLRVRVQSNLTPRVGDGFSALSYRMDLGPGNRVQRLLPEVYHDEDGKELYFGIYDTPVAAHCADCHADRTMLKRHDLELMRDKRFREMPGYKGLLDAMTKENARPEDVAAAGSVLENPTALVPPGLKEKNEEYWIRLYAQQEVRTLAGAPAAQPHAAGHRGHPHHK